MDSGSNGYRIYPPLSACLRLSAKLTFWVALFVMVAIWVMRLYHGARLTAVWSLQEVQALSVFLAAAVAFGLALFAIGRLCCAIAKPGALRGSTFWGRRIDVPWGAIVEVRNADVEGMPMLIVKSSGGTEIWLST